jgi:hypothetical protein
MRAAFVGIDNEGIHRPIGRCNIEVMFDHGRSPDWCSFAGKSTLLSTLHIKLHKFDHNKSGDQHDPKPD